MDLKQDPDKGWASEKRGPGNPQAIFLIWGEQVRREATGEQEGNYSS